MVRHGGDSRGHRRRWGDSGGGFRSGRLRGSGRNSRSAATTTTTTRAVRNTSLRLTERLWCLLLLLLLLLLGATTPPNTVDAAVRAVPTNAEADADTNKDEMDEMNTDSKVDSAANRRYSNRDHNNNNDNNNINDNKNNDKNAEAHPDPNEEDHEGMIYVGRLCPATGRRLSADHDNTVRYVFGTAFDDSHHLTLEWIDLQHEPTKAGSRDNSLPGSPVDEDPHQPLHKTRAQVLQERRHRNLTHAQPIPFGHVETHPLDGGITPVKAVAVEPFWLDATPVTNKEFAKFVASTYYTTDAEKYGWSFVLSSFLPSPRDKEEASSETTASSSSSTHHHRETDPEAEHWVAVPEAYWKQPEGRHTTYRHRETHPVVHVSHRDAAEYCTWKGRRLPGEREWEAAARSAHWSSSHRSSSSSSSLAATTTKDDHAIVHRTAYIWGDRGDWEVAARHANLWGGDGPFPHVNTARDGWRGTSPVRHYPPQTLLGFYDLTGNVWEWMRGGKHRARIVRGGSYVDSLDGSFNHAATLGARSLVHGTTTAGNIGFRCAKPVRKRTEHHYTWHDEELNGQLAVEDTFGKRDAIPMPGWEDQFTPHDDDDNDKNELVSDAPPQKRKKKKVVLKRETISTEL